jgi:hypothetical protein
MDRFYVVISYYSDGSGKPEISFHPDADGAIEATRERSGMMQNVTVYAVSDLPRLVTGEELRVERN